jgi:hypothetical protein
VKPAFLITIDTEGDNLWSQPRNITTRNSHFLPRFQNLCERFGFKPTYLTNYEMACCPVFREFATACLGRGTIEIGMHLHAWNSPPLCSLTADDYAHQPYLIEYPETAIRQKVVFMTQLLRESFPAEIRSHRAGRWSFNEVYARTLAENGYRVDCSVTPRVSWQSNIGDPSQIGGTDYSCFPNGPYWLDLDDISRPGNSTLLELPMTISSLETRFARWIRESLGPNDLVRRGVGRFYPSVAWLRPNGSNLSHMRRILSQARLENRPCVEFMLHSSEFMPGGSPTFPSERSIERLYSDLETLFSDAAATFSGATLTEFRDRWDSAAQPSGGRERTN